MHIHQQTALNNKQNESKHGVHSKGALKQNSVRQTALQKGLDVFSWLSSYIHRFFSKKFRVPDVC